MDWDTEGMRDLAARLGRIAGEVRHCRRVITGAMEGAGCWHGAYRELDRAASWADEEAADLTRRAAELDRADDSIRLDVHLGLLDVELCLDLGAFRWSPSFDPGGAALVEGYRHDPAALAAVARFLDTHPSGELDRALFAAFGPGGIAAIPSVVAEAYPDDPTGARRILESISTALGRATRSGNLGFGPEELIAAWRDGLHPYHPVELLRFGDFSEDFLAEMAVLVLEPFDEQYLPLPLPVPRLFDPPGTEAVADHRLIVLDQVAADAACSIALLKRLAGRGTLPALLFPATPFDDAGFAAGRVLSQIGAAADPTGPRAGTPTAAAAHRAVTGVVGAISVQDLPLPDGVAVGAAAMLRANLPSLVPSGLVWDGDAYTRPLTGTAPGGLQDLPRNPALHLDQAELRGFLLHILASEAATTALLDVLSGWIVEEVTTRTAREQAVVLDEVGAVLGRVVAIRSSIEIEQGRASDSERALLRRLVGLLVGAALTLTVPGTTPLWAKLLAGAATKQGTDRVTREFIPSDAEHEALLGFLGRSGDYEKDFWLVLSAAGIWNTEPEWFGDTPPPTDASGQILLPDPDADPLDPEVGQIGRRWAEWMNRLPPDRLVELEKLAGLALGQMTQADDLEGLRLG